MKEATENADKFVSASRALTFASSTLIIVVVFSMVWAIAKLHDRKLRALSFFGFVHPDTICRLVKSCEEFQVLLNTTKKKKTLFPS